MHVEENNAQYTIALWVVVFYSQKIPIFEISLENIIHHESIVYTLEILNTSGFCWRHFE
jgi:hypothetical protein